MTELGHRDRCAIAGIGASDSSRASGRSALTLATEASLWPPSPMRGCYLPGSPDLQIGMPMAATFECLGDGTAVPVWAPAARATY